MTTFNVSFLNSKMRSSKQDYGFLVDGLDIKKNSLAADGKLAPGDYDLLIEEARKIYAHPGLTREQRSNIEVKISEFQSQKSNVKLKDTNDIQRLGREIDDEFRTQNMLLANNPTALLESRSDAYKAKLQRLTESIDSLESAGDDALAHYEEYNNTVNEYQDVVNALESSKNYKNGSEPSSDMVAYIKTNSNGEITDVTFGKTGSKTGYAETNGVYGGMKIYGKINRKEEGKNVFKLGSTTFSAADVAVPDPTNPLGFKTSPLMSERSLKQNKGGVSIGQKGTFDVIDPASIPIQSVIKSGGYAKGPSGFIYEKLPNGTYKKYTKAKPENLRITENDILPIPSAYEQNITRNVSETTDDFKSFVPQTPTNLDMGNTASTTTRTTNNTGTASTTSAVGIQQGKQPTVRAPQTTQGVAGQVFKSVGNFFSKFIK